MGRRALAAKHQLPTMGHTVVARRSIVPGRWTLSCGPSVVASDGRQSFAPTQQVSMRVPRRLRRDAAEVLWCSRVHWWSLARDIGFAIVLAIASGFAVGALAGRYVTVVAAIALVLWLTFSAAHVLGWWYSRLVVTDRKIAFRPGSRSRNAILFDGDDIAEVAVHRSLSGRLMGFAALEIHTHASVDGRDQAIDSADGRHDAAWIAQVGAADEIAELIAELWLNDR